MDFYWHRNAGNSTFILIKTKEFQLNSGSVLASMICCVPSKEKEYKSIWYSAILIQFLLNFFQFPARDNRQWWSHRLFCYFAFSAQPSTSGELRLFIYFVNRFELTNCQLKLFCSQRQRFIKGSEEWVCSN